MTGDSRKEKKKEKKEMRHLYTVQACDEERKKLKCQLKRGISWCGVKAASLKVSKMQMH